MTIPYTFNRMGVSASGGGGDMPTSGLVFYAPLSDSTALSAETGQALTYTGTFTSETYKGITSLNTTQHSCITMNDTTGFPTGNDPWTVSFWMNERQIEGGDFAYAFTMGTEQQYSLMLIGSYPSQDKFQFGPGWVDTTFDGFTQDTWYHMVESYDGSQMHFYVNGVKQGVINYNASISYDITYTLGLFARPNVDFQEGLLGNVAAVRVYDRCLSDDEITQLATEFTPTV